MCALSVDQTNARVESSVFAFPRLYRRFFRLFAFVFFNVHVPRHLGSFAVVFFFFITALYGVLSSGRAETIVAAAISNVGFAVTSVDVRGNKRVARQEILELLELDVSQSMFTFDVGKARSALEQHVWVESANVQKVYPNRLCVTIVERKPYAIWQHDGVLDVIDSTGRVIVPFQGGRIRDLPLVVGQGAQISAKAFIQALSVYPEVYDRVRAYVRIGDRRWDLILNNGVRVMLPEDDVLGGLTSLIKTGRAQYLFSRDVLSVDLRLLDRITVSLSDDALARRDAAVAEEERVLKAYKAGDL
ncbi:cell division protein FtsQ/DivIB [Bartonella sp. CB178]|uniref:cell division protein FtsQ/DivIB n=1 Tax=Bartonella sp. CB178 TaxID=3112255 RepID=UPI00300DCD24